MHCLYTQDRRPSASEKQVVDVMLWLGVVLALLLTWKLLVAQQASSPEYQAKASFLSKLPTFAEWPESALPSGSEPFLTLGRK